MPKAACTAIKQACAHNLCITYISDLCLELSKVLRKKSRTLKATYPLTIKHYQVMIYLENKFEIFLQKLINTCSNIKIFNLKQNHVF